MSKIERNERKFLVFFQLQLQNSDHLCSVERSWLVYKLHHPEARDLAFVKLGGKSEIA